VPLTESSHSKVLGEAHDALTNAALALRHRKELQAAVNKTLDGLGRDKGGSASFGAHEKLLRGGAGHWGRSRGKAGVHFACLLKGRTHCTCCHGVVPVIACWMVLPIMCSPQLGACLGPLFLAVRGVLQWALRVRHSPCRHCLQVRAVRLLKHMSVVSHV
jgi:hypothetical protein